MKKLFSLILVFTIAMSFAACGASEETPFPGATPDVSIQSATAPESAPVQDSSAPKEKVMTSAVRQAISTAAETVPAFTVTDFYGNTITEDFFADKKLVMINFWEPWCGPCIAEMPDIEKLYEAYSDEGFAVLGIHDSDSEEIEEMIELYGITYPLTNNADAFDFANTGSVPTTVFVDGSGTILTTPIIGSRGFDDWAEFVDYFLG